MSDRVMMKADSYVNCEMTKKIVMGPYFKYDEEDDWMSRENVIEGTVRIIEDALCYAVYTRLELDNSEYDPCSIKERTYKDVIVWEFYDSAEQMYPM